MHFLYQQRKLERFLLGFIDLWSKNTALQTAIDLGKPMSAFFQWIPKSLTTCMFCNILIGHKNAIAVCIWNFKLNPKNVIRNNLETMFYSLDKLKPKLKLKTKFFLSLTF